ncbi:uncharacterized vacuolar membrane protein [[Candida] jaroonii]|uniref:Uncharacterized vacuolar membrane protein n=1 Tax=[Candida] jaroonii TaxID=467808 RepID=A0ACA9Y6R0_9ASCO|nr:uncharacterized vacuolar membrane protein [[Candida] jaroonii]
MLFKYNTFLTSAGLRGAQLVLTIITLGLAAANVSYVAYDRANFSVAVTVISLIYLVLVSVPMTLAFIPHIVLIIGESIMWVFWLALFACNADVFGAASCSVHYYYYYTSDGYENFCRTGKALIAMGVINWLLFTASLVLMILYTIIPMSSTLTSMSKGDMVLGGIFHHQIDGTVTKESDVDIEKHEDGSDVLPEPTVTEPITDEPVVSGPVATEPTLDPATGTVETTEPVTKP